MLKNASVKLANTGVFAFTAILLVYFFTRVDLSLVYHVNQPFFANNIDFLKEYLSYPGGIMDYLGLFVFQFYGNKMIALFLVLLQIGIWFYFIYQLIKKHIPAAFVPVPVTLSAVPLILVHGSYQFTPEISFTYTVAVGLTILYRMFNLRNANNYLIYFPIAFIIYYVTGSVGLSIFLAINLAFHVYEKKYILSFLFFVCVAVLPFLWYLFDQRYTSIGEAYWGHFITGSYDPIPVIINSAPIFVFIILLIILFLSSLLNKANVTKWLIIFNFIVILPVIFFVTFKIAFNPTLKKIIQVDKLAYEEKWDDLLKTVDVQIIQNKPVLSLVNRALYHKGILLNCLFLYPQSFHQEALIMQSPTVPLSEIYFDMGFINESRHWANEAYTVLGKKPRILKRLVETYIITGQYKTAEMYLKILESSFITDSWAQEYRKYLYCDSCVENDPKLGRLRKMNPSTDFFAATDNPVDNLKYLMADSIPNQMAFEYYIAHSLLINEPGDVLNNINKFKSYGYTQLPWACQEAVLLYKATRRINTFDDLSGYTIDVPINTNFINFSNVLFGQYKGDKAAARSSLSNFSKTYWYYYLYSRPLKSAINNPDSYSNDY